jgi:N-carbamoylputrescine amidase|tara:strand:+ start:10125 stop:11012 length:888 start_codon:yes stop_codon:yes gene_type:complete
MNVTIAATQMACTWDLDKNIEKAINIVHQSADLGAEIILLQELFETPYFCIDTNNEHFNLAKTLTEQPTIKKMQVVAKDRGVVLPISFFEKSGLVYFNSIVVIDADGSIVGHYRKSHIPDFPLYEEKFYFSPGDTGFRAFDTRFGRIGIGICWDQWFPEAARAMALMGAEILLYPTAIGNELDQPDFDSKNHWQTTMRGHAAANIMPVIASNRIGNESSNNLSMEFYGSSFISNHLGELVSEADRESENILTHTFDLDEISRFRRDWGVFRDRRPDLYEGILSLDGNRTQKIDHE